jgi:hypothetical protein
MRTQRLMAVFVGLVFGGLSLNAGAAAPVETSREVFVAEISSLSQVRFSCKPGVSIDKPFPTHSHVYISLLGLTPASNVLNLSSWGPDFANAQLGDHCAEMTAALEKQLPAQGVSPRFLAKVVRWFPDVVRKLSKRPLSWLWVTPYSRSPRGQLLGNARSRRLCSIDRQGA